jgi:hypothetical protein
VGLPEIYSYSRVHTEMNTTFNKSRLFFDNNDHILLNIVNDVLNRDIIDQDIKDLLTSYLHPHGIKEMTASTGLRIAYAAIHLLGSLEAGKAIDRQNALRLLRDEVFCSSQQGVLHNNTARILLEIMKELVRSKDDYVNQLQLARDFRMATFGKPRFIRRQLAKHHLIEMPEEWNQIAFDDHVHDANTKGRKSPTHMVMDAWIKGIRSLNVIYYNFINVDVATELMESSEIMGISVRIGIEYLARFRGRYIKFFWLPRGFADRQAFIDFLNRGATRCFMEEGRKVSEYQQDYVFSVLDEFNRKHRLVINEVYGTDLAPIVSSDFLAFVGSGQPSLHHLAKYIHTLLFPEMRQVVNRLRSEYEGAEEEERLRIRHAIEVMNALDPDAIVESFLQPSKNPGVHNPNEPHEGPNVPELLLLSPEKLLERVANLNAGFRVTLNLTGLSPADVLELLYDCKGRITHLEIFNLKDHAAGIAGHNAEINRLQLAINQGNVIKLKRVINKIIQDTGMEADPVVAAERTTKLTAILHDMPSLQGYYKNSLLKSRFGTDSTGISRNRFGMGLVVKDTLPRRSQKVLDHDPLQARVKIPVRMTVLLRVTYAPRDNSSGPRDFENLRRVLSHALIKTPSGMGFGYEQHKDWVVPSYSAHMEPNGNLALLGGVRTDFENGRLSLDPELDMDKSRIPVRYMNTHLKNGLKILGGFIPAFATFALTKDWWLLAYFGAFIWFGITGGRNIIQSVLGGGGLRRSPLLRWNDYISWDRLADSLFYTGFSVPLLDLVVKTLILDRMFGVNTQTNPLVLYAAMALANGIYISSHNIFRGLPWQVAFGNFFRSVLSIPLAVLLNAVIGSILGVAGEVAVQSILQKWAAVISKLASDCVAAIIEGLADRSNNIRLRFMDYSTKVAQVFEVFAKLEVLFPDADVISLLESPKEFLRLINEKQPDLGKIVIINALDLLYIWMYQPRAESTLNAIMRSMNQEECRILVASQCILKQQRQISQLFVDEVLGKKFSKALSFYLDRSEDYLRSLQMIFEKFQPHERGLSS